MLVKVPLYIYLKQIAIKSCSDMGPQGVKSFLPTNQGSVVLKGIFLGNTVHGGIHDTVEGHMHYSSVPTDLAN